MAVLSPKTEYKLYLKGERWNLIRKAVLRRDNWTCQYPGCSSRKHLNTHHRTYRNKGKGLAAEIADCMTLCRKHHKRVHGIK